MEAINSPFLVDVVLIILLSTVLLWLFKVNWTLAKLRNSRGELAQLLQQFTMATQRAEESTRTLKSLGSNTLKTIETASEKGKKLYDDLSYLVERGTKMADQLEVVISEGRHRSNSVTKPFKQSSAKNSPAAKVSGGAEPSDLISGLENLR